MASEMSPASKKQAPDPSNSYERSHPENESGMGRLDNNMNATPCDSPDKMDQAVKHRQDPGRQINAGDAVNQRGGPTQEQPTHSMHDEEPMGSDQRPLDINDPRQQR